jgi:hypothetical protein
MSRMKIQASPHRRRHGATRRGIATLIVVALLAAPAWSKKKKVNPEDEEIVNAGIRGKIYAADGKRTIAGVVVRAVDLNDGSEYRSEPSDGKGRFRLEGIPHGYYDIGFEAPDGLYVGSQVINVPPGGYGVVAVRLGVVATDDGSTFPEAERQGVAVLERKLNVREFWRSPKGIAIIAAVGGSALLGLAVTSGDNDSSTFTIN